ncbi:hypothetical protein PCE1_004084 [Barthelona sp. PCE]
MGLVVEPEGVFLVREPCSFSIRNESDDSLPLRVFPPVSDYFEVQGPISFTNMAAGMFLPFMIRPKWDSQCQYPVIEDIIVFATPLNTYVLVLTGLVDIESTEEPFKLYSRIDYDVDIDFENYDYPEDWEPAEPIFLRVSFNEACEKYFKDLKHKRKNKKKGRHRSFSVPAHSNNVSDSSDAENADKQRRKERKRRKEREKRKKRKQKASSAMPRLDLDEEEDQVPRKEAAINSSRFILEEIEENPAEEKRSLLPALSSSTVSVGIEDPEELNLSAYHSAMSLREPSVPSLKLRSQQPSINTAKTLNVSKALSKFGLGPR